MHRAIDEIAEKYSLSSKSYITFLGVAIVEEFVKQEHSEEDMIQVLDGIFDTYLKVKEIIKEKGK
jgi:hypothetical protein